MSIGFSAGPDYDRYFKYWEHRDMLEAAPRAIKEAEARFAEVFGRRYSGMIECVACDDADVVLVTLGSVAGLVRGVVERLRAQGVRAGMLRIRYLRPMPSVLVATALAGAKAVGVLEKDVSFGAEGTVYTNVNSALQQAGARVPTYNFIGGLGGDDISEAQVEGMFPRSSRRRLDGTLDLPHVVVLGDRLASGRRLRKEVDSHGRQRQEHDRRRAVLRAQGVCGLRRVARPARRTQGAGAERRGRAARRAA